MTEYNIREYCPGDRAALTALWRQVFGDPEEVVAAFFDALPRMGIGAVAEAEGRPVGAAYVLDALAVVDAAGREQRCGYLYAVAVDPGHRHQGLGAALSQKAAALSLARGAELICTLPAEPSLYAWYEEILGLGCALHRKRYAVTAGPVWPVERLCPGDYLARREALLAGVPHLRPAPAVMDFAGQFYALFGGGLYACGGGLCAVYVDDDRVLIRELIASAGVAAADVAAALCAALGCREGQYMLPDSEGEPYLSAPAGVLPPDCVWNLSFD